MLKVFLRVSVLSLVLSLMLSSSPVMSTPSYAFSGADPNAMQGIRRVGTRGVRPSRRQIVEQARSQMPDINTYVDYHRQLREKQQRLTIQESGLRNRRRINRLLRRPGSDNVRPFAVEAEEDDEDEMDEDDIDEEEEDEMDDEDEVDDEDEMDKPDYQLRHRRRGDIRHLRRSDRRFIRQTRQPCFRLPRNERVSCLNEQRGG